MALVVEDGSLIAGATSYVTVAEIRDYATARGIEIPMPDNEIEQAAIRGMDVLEAKCFKGFQTYADQDLQFPRYGISRVGYYTPYPFDTIPKAIKTAQIELAIASANGLDLMPTLDGAEVKREKVGPIETEYVTGTMQGLAPVIPVVSAMLRPFLDNALRTVRV